MKKTNIYKIVLLTVIGIAAAIFFGFNKQNTYPAAHQENTLNVVASFYPIADFAEQIGGNLVNVTSITPSGVEPHDYEPTPQQMAGAYAAKVFLYNGGGVDTWAERIAPQLSAQGIITARMSLSIPPAPIPATNDDTPYTYDPHFWLDPQLAKNEVALILETLTKADPVNAEVYTANATSLINSLSLLHQEYESGLANCANRTIITSHGAFAYLAWQYHFTVIPIAGLSPDNEPSAGRLAQIAKTAQQEGLKYIFFETLVSPKLSQTLAREVGAQTLVFNPLEGLTEEEKALGKNYLSVMRENLKNLQIGMNCK